MQEIGIISILDKQWEYTKESTEMYYKWVTSMSFIFFPPLPSELQTLMKNKKWDFKVMDAYHQAYITNSKTQPPARIFFNKTLDINTHSPSSPRH